MTRHITLSLGAAPILALLLAGCATSGEMADRGPIKKGGTVPTEAQAAVLKTFFNNNASAIQNGAAAFCVASIDAAGRHYSDANLLSALSDNPKVKPASACSAPNTGAPVIETATGKSALLFNVSPLRCDSPGDCLVSVSYYEANLSAQQNLYRAKKSGGRWTVTLEQPGPVS